MLAGSESSPEALDKLGARVRYLRQLRRLSIREVAGRAGVSPSFLSQFERGLSDASVGSLRQICQAIGTTPAEIMAPKVLTDHAVIRSHERVGFEGTAGTRKFPVSSQPSEAVEVYLGEIDPGVATSDKAYAHGDSVEIVYVLNGKISYEIGSSQIDLESGDSIEHRTSKDHRIVNIGCEVAEVMWIIAPPS